MNYVIYTDYGENKMISQQINEVLNEQINKELYSGYLYLSMSAKFKEMGLIGFAHWLKEQAKEEVEHGLKIYDYLINRDSFVILKQIRTPDFDFNNILQVFNEIYEHERCITKAIMSIAKVAEEECDRTTLKFLDWFVEEQVQEEESVKYIIKRLEFFGETKCAMFLLDKELSER